MPLDTGMEPSPTPWKVEQTKAGAIYVRAADGRVVAVFGTGAKIDFANAKYVEHLVEGDEFCDSSQIP